MCVAVNKVLSVEMSSKDVRITGVRAYAYNTVDEFAFTTAGSGGYVLALQQNPLITEARTAEVANAVNGLINGMGFRPYSAKIEANPLLEAGDAIAIMDYKGNYHISLITNLTFNWGSATSIACGAESASKKDLELSNPTTSVIQSAVTAAYDYIAAKKISADSITAGTLGVNGTITATDLEITGGEVGGLSIIDSALETAYTHPYTYTSEDATRIQQIILGNITPTDEDYELYDFDGNGIINTVDYARCNKLVQNYGGVLTTTVRIDPHSINKTFYVEDNTEASSSIGSGGANFYNTSSRGFKLVNSSGSQLANLTSGTNNGGSFSLYDSSEAITITCVGGTGVVTAASFVNSSRLDLKQNLTKIGSVLDKIKSADILSFNFKDEADDKKHIGLAIGGDYNVPEEVISVDEEGKEQGVDLYSMVSMAWKAIQEQQEIIESLENRIEVLEKKLNPIGTIKDIIKGDTDGNTN